MIEQLISRVFYARNVAHVSHWKTSSYAQHSALGDFYDGVIGALDALVEAHQALNGLVGSVPTPEAGRQGALALLKADAKWIEDNHEKVCGKNRAIGNLLDGVTEVYLKTIYKLEHLK